MEVRARTSYGDITIRRSLPASGARHAGGQNVSRALTWTGVPAGTAQLLFLIEDPDAPTRTPWVHCVALLDPGLAALPAGALNEGSTSPEVRVLHGTRGCGYQGPEGIQGHGPDRYVFQLFALPSPLPPRQAAGPWSAPNHGPSSPPRPARLSHAAVLTPSSNADTHVGRDTAASPA